MLLPGGEGERSRTWPVGELNRGFWVGVIRLPRGGRRQGIRSTWKDL